jgi:hypothetical protein
MYFPIKEAPISKREVSVGDRVMLLGNWSDIGYIWKRRHYTNMYIGKVGTVIRIASTGKIGVEFDDEVFTKWRTQLSTHDNGCHGNGKLHYCWYIPTKCLTIISKPKQIENEELLLLL